MHAPLQFSFAIFVKFAVLIANLIWIYIPISFAKSKETAKTESI